MKNISRILWGIVLVLIGGIFGLNELGITSINVFFNGWWTLFIIVPCFIGLLTQYEKKGNIIGLLVGIILLLCCNELIDIYIASKLILPIILIIIGLSFIFKDVFNSKINKKIKELNKSKKDDVICATFSSEKIKYDKEEFNGTDINAIFGGVELDLRESIITKDVVINTTSVFGGVDILVPSDVKIKVKSSSIFGGVSNKKNSENKKEITIYINATCLFGGVDIK